VFGASEAEFRRLLKEHFTGPLAKHSKATIQQGDPLKGLKIEVNQTYPDSMGFTTVPPTLLLKLPELPEDVTYKILGSDLLLVADKALIILDFMPSVIPPVGS
jgi:hypothetical protein